MAEYGPSFVYFIEADTDPPLIKIGNTKDVVRRVAGIASQSPIPVRLIGYFHGHTGDELCLHRLFKHHRHHGEWFEAVPELRAIADSHASALDGEVHEAHQGPEHLIAAVRALWPSRR